jgi:galactokinase
LKETKWMLLFYTYYVVKEIARVSKACEALDAGNIELLGQLLLKEHTMVCLENMSGSCPRLDYLLALADEAVIGSRLMGWFWGFAPST